MFRYSDIDELIGLISTRRISSHPALMVSARLNNFCHRMDLYTTGYLVRRSNDQQAPSAVAQAARVSPSTCRLAQGFRLVHSTMIYDMGKKNLTRLTDAERSGAKYPLPINGVRDFG